MDDQAFYKIRRAILCGIDAELKESAEPSPFSINKRERDGQLWRLTVNHTRSHGGLDESLEGATAWWAEPTKGSADVLSALPDKEQVILRYANAEPPDQGGNIFIYPPRYLEALHKYWTTVADARHSLSWLERIKKNNTFDKAAMPCLDGLPAQLRQNQRKAFELLGWDVGFLWGPPGTGKTFTLGAMLARYLLDFPQARILLISSTNVAVDIALTATDDTLSGLGRNAESVRKKCHRIGHHFIASYYTGREHLLPGSSEEHTRKLTALESKRPEPENIHEYAAWKADVEEIRAAMRAQARGVLEKPGLGAMTIARAVFTLDTLREIGQFDLIVFDEASQVALANALAIAPLGKKVLFAGDDRQLAPVLKSTEEEATEWLGQSMFKFRIPDSPSTCMLVEQSRMSEAICKLVGNTFYDRCLSVAEDARKDPNWNKARDLPPVQDLEQKSIVLLSLPTAGIWSQNYLGPIRHDSAVLIQDLVKKLILVHAPSEILILTPFRAQRRLIREFLRNAGLKGVNVSTVHRAQGSESHTVIFDPVEGNNNFLKTADAARLVNVAISRAKARLVVILSPGDRENPLLDRLGLIIESASSVSGAKLISDLIRDPKFPQSALGQDVNMNGRIGRITAIHEDGKKFVFLNLSDGTPRQYVTEFLRQRFTKEP